MNNDKIIEKLNEGNFFCSKIFKEHANAFLVVAETFCQILVLQDKDLEKIKLTFPFLRKKKNVEKSPNKNSPSHYNDLRANEINHNISTVFSSDLQISRKRNISQKKLNALKKMKSSPESKKSYKFFSKNFK